MLIQQTSLRSAGIICCCTIQIFDAKKMKFSEIPGKLQPLLMPPDPIVINHVITYVIDVCMLLYLDMPVIEHCVGIASLSV